MLSLEGYAILWESRGERWRLLHNWDRKTGHFRCKRNASKQPFIQHDTHAIEIGAVVDMFAFFKLLR